MQIKISLYYTSQLMLKIKNIDFVEFVLSPFFKLRVKRFVQEASTDKIIFKKDIVYSDINKIINILEVECNKKNWSFFCSKNLLDYLKEKELYIESRYRVGFEIKNKDEKFDVNINDYNLILKEKMSRELRKSQVWDSFFMYCMKKSGNFSVPGSGKTSSVLGMFAYLKYKNLVNKIVMIGPKNSFGSWLDEFSICFGDKEQLVFFNVHDRKYKNKKCKIEDIKYNSGKVNMFLFNYESLKGLEDELLDLIDSKCLLVYDEVHKIKKINGVIASTAISVSKNAKYIVTLTGTPIPNSYLDIYNILNLLYSEEYKSFFGFSTNMLKNPSENDVISINQKIQPFFCRTTKEDLKVPKANDDIIFDIKCSLQENKLFNILFKKYRGNKFTMFIRMLQMESDPQMLLENLDLSQFTHILDDDFEDINEIDFADYSEDIVSLIKSISITTKINKCIELVKMLVNENKPVIIWCIFINSMNLIKDILVKLGIKVKVINGSVPLENRVTILEDFKKSKLEVVITNPHTLAESISLHTVCHDAIYFEYSYNLVHLLQSKDRIHRLGLKSNQYTQYYYLMSNFTIYGEEFSLDKQIYDRLSKKEQIMLNAIENNVLENLTSTQEDLELIFENLDK